MQKEIPKELSVIAKAKEISKYLLVITQNAPKKLRFPLIASIQNLSLYIIKCLYNANDSFIDLQLLKDLNTSLM